MNLVFVQSLARDRFLHLLLIVGVVLSFFVPFAPGSWLHAIDWHTIITLSGLMLLTKGIELSGYFDVIGRKMARRKRNDGGYEQGLIHHLAHDRTGWKCRHRLSLFLNW